MTDQTIAITIMVPTKDIEIETEVFHYSETSHEPQSSEVKVASVDIPSIPYIVDSWDVIDIDNLAVERCMDLSEYDGDTGE